MDTHPALVDAWMVKPHTYSLSMRACPTHPRPPSANIAIHRISPCKHVYVQPPPYSPSLQNAYCDALLQRCAAAATTAAHSHVHRALPLHRAHHMHVAIGPLYLHHICGATAAAPAAGGNSCSSALRSGVSCSAGKSCCRRLTSMEMSGGLQ